MSEAGDKRHAPATGRNREPLLAVLAEIYDTPGTVLEIASGSGEHVIFFAAKLPHLTFQPSDIDPASLASIAAWARETNLDNVKSPIHLDASAASWPLSHADHVLSVNMIHIAPREALLGLVRGASALLPPSGTLTLYGPFREGGSHTAPSNEAFDASLRARDPAWGVRDLEDVLALGAAGGFAHDRTVRMPANNLVVVLRRETEAQRLQNEATSFNRPFSGSLGSEKTVSPTSSRSLVPSLAKSVSSPS